MTWEYYVLNIEDKSWMGGVLDPAKATAQLNALGLQGWELVSGFDTNIGNGASRSYVFVFKRPRSGQQ